MFEEKLDALSRMTTEHMALPFPPGFRGLDMLAAEVESLREKQSGRKSR